MSYSKHIRKLQELDKFFISHQNTHINLIKSKFKKFLISVSEEEINYDFFHTLFFSDLVSNESTKKHIFPLIEIVFDQYPDWHKSDNKKNEISKLGINTVLRIDSYPGAFDFFMKIIDKVDLNYLDNASMSMSYYLFLINGEKRITLLNSFIDKNIQHNDINNLNKICDFYLNNLYDKIYHNQINNIEKIEIDTLQVLLTHPETQYEFKKAIFFHPIFNHPAINSISLQLDLNKCLKDKSLVKNERHIKI